jgi:hypothetical protein
MARKKKTGLEEQQARLSLSPFEKRVLASVERFAECGFSLDLAATMALNTTLRELIDELPGAGQGR